MPLYSIVIPVFRSRAVLPVLLEAVDSAMRHRNINYELILVDDGSSDGTFEEIQRHAQQYKSIRGYRLTRNFGHQAAVWVGLGMTKGEVIGVMDDDLQDPPEVLAEFFAKIAEGYDVVYGLRRQRKEGAHMRMLYKASYWALNQLSFITIPEDAGDFCAMRRNVLDSILRLKDTNPFIRGIRAWVGYRQVGVPYSRAARYAGSSGYTLRKLIVFAATGIFSFSVVPLRLGLYLGIPIILISLFLTILGSVLVLFGAAGNPWVWIGMTLVFFFAGLQLLVIGILGEYIAKIAYQSKGWPVALVAESTNPSADSQHNL